jgi:hypothetical protein
LERHVLDAPRMGWHREDDVVSALIPQHYFDYLRGGPSEPLAGVMRHNQMDLRGLAALFGKIDLLLAEENRPDQEVDSLDLFGLSRYLKRRGDSDRAHTACAQALDLGLPTEFRPQARRELALLAKRRGHHENAALLWHELATELTGNDQDGIHACEQLAIYYERRVKDFTRAAEFAQLALAKVRRLRTNSRDPHAAARGIRLEQTFLNRITRLEHRIKLTTGGCSYCVPLADPKQPAGSSGARASDAVSSEEETGWKLQP